MDITSDRIRGMNGFLSLIDDILISMNPTLKARDLVFEEDLKGLSDQIDDDETVTAKPPKERPDPLGPNERYVVFKNMIYKLGPVDKGVAKIYGKHGLAGLVIDKRDGPSILSKIDTTDGFSPEAFGDYLITLTATDRNELQREQKRANELINQIVSDPDNADEAVSELKQKSPVVYKLIAQAIGNLVSQGGGIIEPESQPEPEQEKPATPIMTPDEKSAVNLSVNAALAAIKRRHHG